MVHVMAPILAQKYNLFLIFTRVFQKSGKNGGFWHYELLYFVSHSVDWFVDWFVGRSTVAQTSLFILYGMFTNL